MFQYHQIDWIDLLGSTIDDLSFIVCITACSQLLQKQRMLRFLR
jgi:hypothetical protein